MPAALTILGVRYEAASSGQACRSPEMQASVLEIEGMDLAAEDYTATISFSEYDQTPVLVINLKYPASEAFAELTAAKVGETLALSVDGEVWSEPRIMEPIYGGQVQITGGDRSIEELERLARRLAPICD